MQSSATTTFSTHRRHTDVPGHNRNRNHGPAPTRVNARPNTFQHLAKPVQPASSKDFHLDAFFNPVWMSGPHVFLFAKDGTVVRPETYRTEPYPGYQTSAASSSGRNVYGAALPSPSFSHAPISKASGRMDKAWKNIAITEQDDAEFAEMEAEAGMRAPAEAKGKLMGLVYTWPPKPQPGACAECEVLVAPRQRAGAGALLSVSTGTGMGTQESAVPELSYGSSGESESESEVFRVVPGRRDVVRRKKVPLEKGIGFGRLPRKAPAPLLLTGMDEGGGENVWTLFGTPREVRKYGGNGFLSPLVAEPWVEDQLTASLKAMLKMPEV